MIVFSSDLVLTEDTALDPDLPVIGYQTIVTATNVADDDGIDGEFPPSNVANPATDQYWLAENTVEQYLTVTTETVDDIDYVAVAGHNFGTAGIAVSIVGLVPNSPPVFDELTDPFIPADDSPILFRFEPQTLTEVKLRMQMGSDPARVSVMYVGKLLVLQRSITVTQPHTPINLGRKSKTVNPKSENGNFLGRIVLSEWNQGGAAFEWFEPLWFREEFVPFLNSAIEIPYFFAWNPVEQPLEVGYVWNTEDPIPEVDPVTRRVACEIKYEGVV